MKVFTFRSAKRYNHEEHEDHEVFNILNLIDIFLRALRVFVVKNVFNLIFDNTFTASGAWEPVLYLIENKYIILNLMAVTPERGNEKKSRQATRKPRYCRPQLRFPVLRTIVR